MVYSNQYDAFLKNKNQFFINLSSGAMIGTIPAIEEQAKHVDYTFLLENQKALEDEFTHTFSILQKQKEDNEEAFWFYCYYCATLLETFYKAYSQKGKEEEYKRIKQQLKNRLAKVTEKEAIAEESFIESLKNSFIGGFRNLINTPYHISQIRDYVALSNLYRVYWVFCRLTLVTGFTLAKELQLIEKLDSILGSHIDVDKIVSTLQLPNGLLNYFSVGLFLIRFFIDGALLLKHTFFPSDEEKKNGTTPFDRFKYEFYKRHCNFANDLVWATVNFITNFNQITHIPNPVAGAITAVFLGFDFCMALWKCHLAKQEYLAKKAQYTKEIEDYNNPNKFHDMSDKQKLAHIVFLKRQLDELEINWRTKQGTFYFVASGAALLVLGFSASLLFTPPGMVFASFFVCTLAVAMYLSTDAYSAYKEKSLRLEQAQLLGANCATAQKEYEAARNDFIVAMVKNTLIPTLLIATFAVCWPAAVTLTALYVGYELYTALNKHNSSKEIAPIASNNSIDRENEEDIELTCCFA